MSRAPFFPEQVDRLCRDRRGSDGDTPFDLDAAGFLDVSVRWWRTAGAALPGGLLTPEEASGGGALVLLGEPGVGKSSAFRRLVDGLTDITDQADGDKSHAVLWVDGGDLVDASFDELIGVHLKGLAAPGQPAGELNHPRLTLVIDQLDESPMREWLPGRLGRALDRIPRGAVRLLIACRTADYPPALTDVLNRHVDDYVLADLAPLTRAQAVQLASTVHDDGQALVEAAVAVGAGALASVPLTLELLVRIHNREGRLTGGPAALFAQGTRLLAEEPDRYRNSEQFSVDQRLAVAGRIAARLLLSGRRSIWMGSGLDAREETDLVAGSLAGDQERTTSGVFDVSQAAMKETLGTALFTAHGQDRLGFRHSSLGAYLAARYVHDRDLPRHQLVSLFLVDAPDRDTAGIPVPLREAATWLVALDPANTEWLAAADAESLVAHSVIVDSEPIRSLVVARLLDHAGEVELSETGWVPGRWQVAHPGLAEQLRPTLESTAPGSEWSEHARVRLAVRLARDAAVAELADPLLAITEHDGWDIYERRHAAVTAMEAAPDIAAPRLRALLHTLHAPADTTPPIEMEELEGTLLRLLWPHYLPLQEMLRHVRPSQRSWYGEYERFVSEMANDVHADDFDALLRWACARVGGPAPTSSISPILSIDPDDSDIMLPLDDEPIGQLPSKLLPPIVNRVLGSPVAHEHLGMVATLLWSQLRDYEHPPIPAPLDLVDADGVEPEATTTLRRALASRLVQQAVADDTGRRNADVWAIANDWETARRRVGQYPPPDGLHEAERAALLDSSDFAWALDQADQARESGQDDLAAAMGRLASHLFNGYDPDILALAYNHQDNPAWEHIRWVYDGVPRDSDLADAMRNAVRHGHPRQWDQSEEFIEAQRDRLRLALGDDPNAFWSLAWNLQFDPFTGQQVYPKSDDLRTFVGVSVLGDDAETELLTAALAYLDHGHDHRDSWLGQGKIHYPAWAGCLAITLLHHTGGLHRITDAHWTAWAGALLSPFTSADSGEGSDRRRHLLRIATQRVPTVVATLLRGLVHNDLVRGERPLELGHFGADYSPHIADTMLTLIDQIASALDAASTPSLWPGADLNKTSETRTAAISTWAELLAPLVTAEDPRALKIAADTLARAGAGTSQRSLAVQAGCILLRHDPARFWQPTATTARTDDDFGRELALACASRHIREAILGRLDEEQLADNHRWLSTLFPPTADTERLEPGRITPRDEVRSWRMECVRTLGQRATQASVDQLRRLACEHPDDLEVAAALINARRRVQATRWTDNTSVDNITEILNDPSRRLIRSNTELAKLLLDTLADIADDLPAHGELLWNHTPTRTRSASGTTPETWAPKFEAALSAYLAHELKIRLHGRGIVVNREVLILPRDAYGAGDRTDILVQTTTYTNTSGNQTDEQPTVVIEVKPTWNRDLVNSYETQLVHRYLPEAGTDTGIYVIGYYPLNQWTAQDYRKTNARRFPPDTLYGLKDQALRLNKELGVHTTPFILTIPHPEAVQVN
ncbi:NACHT domain-containing protein [Actinosynnema sp. CS-041913]|uniref:NACHT domain-containing protein n=1 Tax=Actinosynnema sp. CS-041913 TaxID=3239917 RepID=UPI003D9503F5